MAERVIYCTLASMTMLSGWPHEILQRFSDGVVAAVRNEDILLSRPAPVSLLFFSREAYEQATANLTGPALEAVVRKRLQYWTPNVTGQGLDWTFRGARRCLALTAMAQTSSSGVAAQRLSDHFEQSLQLLVSISGETRYDDLPLPSLLALVAEGEGRLNVEYADARAASQRAGDAKAAEDFGSAARRTEQYGRGIGAVLKELGRPEFADGLAFASLSRGVFVHPQDPDLLKMIAAQREPFVRWKDGLVANWSVDDVPELEKRGKSVQVLYFNSGQFLADLRDLTPEQREREFANRLEGGRGATLQARREHLQSLWLEQHLLRRKALARARSQHAGAAKALAAQVTAEAQMLRDELAANAAWVDARPTSPLDALRACEDQLVRDGRFLAALSKAERDSSAEALFNRISSFTSAPR